MIIFIAHKLRSTLVYDESRSRCRALLDTWFTELLYFFFLQNLLCMYAFPQCHKSVGLPLCYEDCMAVRHEFCFNDWALIEDNRQRGIIIRSRGHFRLPDCDELPKVDETKVTCSHVHLTDVNEELITCEYTKGFFCIKKAGSLHPSSNVQYTESFIRSSPTFVTMCVANVFRRLCQRKWTFLHGKNEQNEERFRLSIVERASPTQSRQTAKRVSANTSGRKFLSQRRRGRTDAVVFHDGSTSAMAALRHSDMW